MSHIVFKFLILIIVILINNIDRIDSQFGRRRPVNPGFFPQQNFQGVGNQQFPNQNRQNFPNQFTGFQQGNLNPGFDQFPNSQPSFNLNNQQLGQNNNLPTQQPPQSQQTQPPLQQPQSQQAAQMQQQMNGTIFPRPALTQQVRDCLIACRTTNEYNPVCGTDQISYGNIQKLQCASQCGQNVQVSRQGRCALRDQIQN